MILDQDLIGYFNGARWIYLLNHDTHSFAVHLINHGIRSSSGLEILPMALRNLSRVHLIDFGKATVCSLRPWYMIHQSISSVYY
jgi:hypothetical protein